MRLRFAMPLAVLVLLAGTPAEAQSPELSVASEADGRLLILHAAAQSMNWSNQTSPNGGWRAWESLGGPSLRQPWLLNDAAGRDHVIALDQGGAVWTSRSDLQGGWEVWRSLGGHDLVQLNAATNLDGRMEIFGTGLDGSVYHRWQLTVNGRWGPWRSLGGNGIRQIAVAKGANGRLQVAALSRAGSVSVCRQVVPNGDWGTWGSLAGHDLQQVVLAYNQDGRAEVFGVGRDGIAYHRWESSIDGQWVDWVALAGSQVRQIAVVADASGRLACFGRSNAGATAFTRQVAPNGGWGTWASLEGHDLVQITAGRNQDGRLELFGLGADGLAYHRWENAVGGAWGAWRGFTGPFIGRDNPIRPFDVITVGRDVNGYPLNPRWGFQVMRQTGSPPFDHTTIVPGNQQDPASWKNLRSSPVSTLSGNGCGPHVNFEPVCYQAERLKFVSISDYTKTGTDWDWNFDQYRDDVSLFTMNNPNIYSEFDTEETTNFFKIPEWNDFRQHCDRMNGKRGITIGLMGLDCAAHNEAIGDHHCAVEMHPVFIAAFQLDGRDPKNDIWLFFARNLGNEGYCSPDDDEHHPKLYGAANGALQEYGLVIPAFDSFEPSASLPVVVSAKALYHNAGRSDPAPPQNFRTVAGPDGLKLVFGLPFPETQVGADYVIEGLVVIDWTQNVVKTVNAGPLR